VPGEKLEGAYGCKWRGLPKRFGKWHTIYTRMNRWSKNGVLDLIFEAYSSRRSYGLRSRLCRWTAPSSKFTPAALELMGEEVTQVQIGFNAETRTVGIRPAEEGAKGKYRLRPQNGSTKRLVDGKCFFAHVGVSIDKAASFDVRDFGDGIIGFYLPEAQEPAESVTPPSSGKTGGRRKKAAN